MGPCHHLGNHDFKKYGITERVFIQKDHSILFLEQVEIMATSALAPFFARLFCSALDLVMMFTLTILNNNNLGDENSTIVSEIL